MKHFIVTHPTLTEDLDEAAKLIWKHCPAESVQYPTTARALERYADELRSFDNYTGSVDPFAKNMTFLLEVGDSKSYFKKWQQNCFDFCKKFDRQIFTWGGMQDLARRLTLVAMNSRNGEECRLDYDYYKKYGNRPSISIGYGCSVAFTPIAGHYYKEDIV